jgi:hypothetical protein
MQNIYTEINADLSSMLHGAARLHVALGRMDDVGIATRGWSYNDLVNGILGLSSSSDSRISTEDYLAIKQHRCIETLFDTLGAIVEIGPNAVSYLTDLCKMK